MNKRDDIQVKSKPRGSNSFVRLGAKIEYEIDIMDVLARDGIGIWYGFVAVDICTKIAEVIPIKNSQPAEMIRVFKQTELNIWGNLNNYIVMKKVVLEREPFYIY